jgi:hypothetical protein
VVRRWPRALPPPESWGTYAAVLAETVRQLLEHPDSRVTAARARDLLARWDDGEPWEMHRTLVDGTLREDAATEVLSTGDHPLEVRDYAGNPILGVNSNGGTTIEPVTTEER